MAGEEVALDNNLEPENELPSPGQREELQQDKGKNGNSPPVAVAAVVAAAVVFVVLGLRDTDSGLLHKNARVQEAGYCSPAHCRFVPDKTFFQ